MSKTGGRKKTAKKAASRNSGARKGPSGANGSDLRNGPDVGAPLGPVFPERVQFDATYQTGTAQVVWTKLVADLETPVSAYLKLAHQDRHAGNPDGSRTAKPLSFLLESVEGGATRGRYSIIGLAPDVIWRADGDHAQINRDALANPDHFEHETEGTLASLRALLAESSITLPEDLPPMVAGVFGHMGYDVVRLVEHLPNQPPDDLGVPDAMLMRPTLMAIFDTVKDEITVVTPVRPNDETDSNDAWHEATQRLATAISKLAEPIPQTAVIGDDSAEAEFAEPVSNTPAHRYLEMVAQAKEYIAAGDAFQIVLSQRFTTPFHLPSVALYRALRRTNPSPFLFHLDFGGYALVGSSPEILVRVRDGEVTIRPIAGTVKRGTTAAEDQELAEQLLSDPKERAEHLMLLDLGRNDVGRVAEIGTVQVTEQFTIERYSHVMHIVSNVIGRLRGDHDAIDALMGGYPAGTVSGAPKVRAMEIIDELEVAKRGPYAGCVGYFSADGNMDTCIVLRTALVKDGQMHIQAGAGVVYDSVPESEQQECINKAKALVRAAEEAVRFAGGHIPGNGSNKGQWS